MSVVVQRSLGSHLQARSHVRSLALAVAAVLALGAAPVLAADEPARTDRIKVIVTFDNPPGKAARRVVERLDGRVTGKLVLVDGVAAELPRGQLRKLARDPLVASVELDGRLTMFDHGANTGDLEYENAWGVEHIGTPAVHAAGIRGAGVRVAVIDTGIDYVHDDPDDSPYRVDPEFSSNYRGGYDFANDDDDPFDDNGHGTHVSGILAAEKNGYLVVGVAPAVDLFALKILDANGEGDVSDLILALQWALDNDIDIVNMSLGTHEVSPALASAVATAHGQGLLMVAASGNVNPLSWQELLYGCPVAYPGAYPEVLATTFTNGSDALTGFSCTGPEVDFAAPGDQILSTVPVGTCMFCTPQGYAAQSGTSMASPHLAGTVALLLSAGIADSGGEPGFLDEVRAQLCSTANTGFGVLTTPIPPTDPRYPNYFGCGVIDADAAVLGLAPPPVNGSPVAADDAATTPQGEPVVVPVTANDSDPDGDPLTISDVGPAANGSATIEPDGVSIRYTPEPTFSGVDSFEYTIADGRGGSAIATVTITVIAAPQVDGIHVGDLDATTKATGKTWTARITIEIHGPGEAVVAGALVTAAWSGGTSGSASCTTGTDGTCTVQKTKLSRTAVPNVSMTVTDVTRSGMTYEPAANHDPDGDSSGTTITVVRPN